MDVELVDLDSVDDISERVAKALNTVNGKDAGEHPAAASEEKEQTTPKTVQNNAKSANEEKASSGDDGTADNANRVKADNVGGVKADGSKQLSEQLLKQEKECKLVKW